MNHPIFSIIIPTYNRAKLCLEAVQSVLGQTCESWELIIVDDGSTDDTKEVLKETKDSRFQYVRQENTGPSAARNKGARLARGKYLAFLDSDDLWLPEKLATQKEFFLQNPSFRICQTEEIWMRKGKRIYPKKKHKKEAGHIFERALELCLVSPSAVAMEKELFWSVGGFDENLPAAEDYDLWLRILCKHPIGLVKEPLVIKRAGEWNQLSFTTEAIDRYRIKALLKILQSGILDREQYSLALTEVKKKSAIFIMGCEKRGKIQEAAVLREQILSLEHSKN